MIASFSYEKQMIREHLEYVSGTIMFFLGIRLTPFWLDQFATGMIGLLFLLVGVIITFFTKRFLEANFNNVFKKRTHHDRK